jgi:DNA polymerase III delta subunit
LTKTRNKQGCLLTQYLFNIICEWSGRAVRQQNETEVIKIGNEAIKQSLFANDNIVYINDPKNSTRELLQLINTFKKINSNKFVALVYTNDK